MKRSSVVASLIVAVLAFAVPSFAQQINSNVASTAASINVGESITLALTGGPLDIPANGSPSNQITIQYFYNLLPANHTAGLQEVAYFGSPTQALSNGTVNVPSSSLSESFNGGAYGACSNGTFNGQGVSGANCVPVVVVTPATLSGGNGVGNGSATYNVEYTGGTLAASGSPYTGTFNVIYYAP